MKQLVLSNHATYGEIHPASLADLLELAKTINIGLVLDMQSLLTSSNTVGYDFQGGVSDECIEIVHNAGLSVSFWGISDTGHFRHNPLRVTYSGYGYAHLGRDYIRQKQADLAAKYPTG